MNRTFKKTLTKLAVETGADWMMLLPFALYQVMNSPYQMELNPIVPRLHLSAIEKLENDALIFRVRATKWSHKHVWPKLHALYEAGPVPEPHKFQPRD